MLVCKVCSAVLVSDGETWACPNSLRQTQFNPHPGLDVVDKRITGVSPWKSVQNAGARRLKPTSTAPTSASRAVSRKSI